MTSSTPNEGISTPWAAIAGVTFVLMLTFLFIAIGYMTDAISEKQKIISLTHNYEKIQIQLTNDLQKEFSNNLEEWNATFDPSTLSIRFEYPEILFKVGSAELNDHFKTILDDFFPRFLQILCNPAYHDDIEEIRIEGHTSSEWEGEPSPRKAYFNNLELSQDRTRKVAKYLLSNIKDEKLFNWTKSYVTANGLSSSKPILKTDGQENKIRSRRVEFRVKTNAEKQMIRIHKQTES